MRARFMIAVALILSACEIQDSRVSGEGPSSQPSSRPAGPGSDARLGAIEDRLARLEARHEELIKLLNQQQRELLARLSNTSSLAPAPVSGEPQGEGEGDEGWGEAPTAPLEAPAKSAPGLDTSGFDGLLKRRVKAGLVDYKGLRDSELGVLDSFLASAARVDPEKLPDDKHRMAFWINLYNAWTLRSILDVYPTASILDHQQGKPKALRGGIWKGNPFTVSGKGYSLDEMEHKILRPMKDPRIHFAIVCASAGCPPLRAEAYVPERLNEQLEDNAKVFFADPSKFKVEGKKVFLSQIFNWFGEDFAPKGDTAALLKACRSWVSDPALRDKMAEAGVSVEFLNYGWGLNEQK